MAIAKKGSRKIVVESRSFRWKVSGYRNVTNWRYDSGIVDERFLAVSEQFGLGEVADIVFNIPIESYDDPVSKILIKYYGKVVSGFLGPEQLGSIKPGLISEVILECLSQGWDPGERGDYSVEVVENTGQKHRPAILILPEVIPRMPGYENTVKLIEIV